MTDIYHFEDFVPGQAFDLGKLTVEKTEIIDFARAFDPQPFHLDEVAGAASLLGALSASGWHTGSMVMGLLARNLLNRSTCQGSPGITSLKWHRPVLPGDELSAVAEVLETKALRSRPELGLASFRISATNQTGEIVMTWENPILFRKREPGT